MRNKKAISPLIATVLVIGFTIVLAALIIQWGGALFRESTEETGLTAKAQIACSTQVKFDITEVTTTADSNVYKVRITNNADKEISGILVRFHFPNSGDVLTKDDKDTSAPITPFGSNTYILDINDLNPPEGEDADEIEVIPKVTPEEGAEPVTCPIESAKKAQVTVVTS
jgi:flagellin-like protein